MKNFSIILSTVAIILAAVAVYSTCKCKAPADAAGGISQEQLAAALTQNPKLVADAMQAYEQLQREEAQKARDEALLAHAAEINSEADVPFVGPKDAKVTVVEFFDFTCGYCKRLSTSIEKVVADNADVKFVFKPLSFVAPVSKYQAQAGMAAHKQGKFMEYYKEVMAFSGLMKEADVDAVAEKIGLNMDQYKADLASDAVKSALDKISSLAQSIQVNGVPTVFVNAKHVQAMSPEPIQEAINAAK